MCSNYYNSKEADKASGDGNDIIEFSLSENAKDLGIVRMAKEGNTIVLEIKVAENEPFVTRTAINFKNWNNFINTIKTSISGNLEEEIEKKQLKRILAYVETTLNKNFGRVKTPNPTNKSKIHTGIFCMIEHDYLTISLASYVRMYDFLLPVRKTKRQYLD